MAYVFQEYPKWVNGQIAQDEAEEAEILAAVKPKAATPTKAADVPKSADEPQPGGSYSPSPDERKAIMAKLNELKIPYFKGASTDALKAKLRQ